MKTDDMVGLSPFAAVFLDIAAWASDLLPWLERDFLTLRALVDTRGLPVILVDLPQAGKVFDRALSWGYLNWSDLPKTFGRPGSDKGVLFGKLFHRVFNENGTIKADVDPNAVYFLRQVLYLAKKARFQCPNVAVLKAIDEFRLIEQEMKIPSVNWELDRPNWSVLQTLSFVDGYRYTPDMFSHRDACPKALLTLLGRVSDLVISQFAPFDVESIVPKHGPGAVADARSGTDKYLFPHWPDKLDHIFPAERFAQSREDLHLEVTFTRSKNEPPVRLLAVPKTFSSPRLIASEPIAHQFIQHGLMDWFRRSLPVSMRTCINYLDQDPSRNAARAASLDGKTATVDLSSASDRLSCWLVERMFRKRPDILEALHACRTRWLTNATRVGEQFFIPLKKYACQGSAAMFALQSIVYSIVAITAVLYERGGRVTIKNVRHTAKSVRVFGDDIILPSSAVQSLTLLLSHIGLVVNMSKTHVKGHFRESCGMDAFHGHDVTPVYIRDLELGNSADGLVSWVDVCNNAYLAGLWNLARWMQDEIPHNVRNLIPVSNRPHGCVTLRTYQNGLVSKSVRFNKALQRSEMLGLQATNRETRRKRDSHQSLLQFFLERPPAERWWDPAPSWRSGWTVRNRKQLRKRWVSTT